MYKTISKHIFKNDYIEVDFPNKKEYYFLGFQSVDYYITKIVYNYLIHYNCNIKFCCSFNLIQKIIKKLTSKEYFKDCFSLDEKYIYSFIGAVICDNNNDVLMVVDEIFDVEGFLLTIFKKEENKYSIVNKFLKKNGYTLITNYNISDDVVCSVDFLELNTTFTQRSSTIIEAKYKVYEEISRYLISSKLLYNINEVIGEYSIDDSIMKLDKLYEGGYLKKPNYIYIEHSEFEEIKYEVRCSIEDVSFYSVKIHTNKNIAKNQAAYSMLEMIVQQNT